MEAELSPRRWWSRGLIWACLALAFVLTVAIAFQLAVRMLPGYRHRIEAEVSRNLGQPVLMQQIGLTWRWAQPMLEISDLRILSADSEATLLNVGKLRLGFATLGMLQGEFVPAEINLESFALTVAVDAQGKFTLRGFASGGAEPELEQILQQLQRFKRIKIAEMSLLLDDARYPTAPLAAVLKKADLRIQKAGMELRAVVQAPSVIAEEIDLKAGFAGDARQWEKLHGQWRLEATGLTPSAPLAARWPAFGKLGATGADVQAFGSWRGKRLGETTLDFQALRLELRDPQYPAALSKLAFHVRYQPDAQGGSLQLRNLQMEGTQGAWPKASARLAWQNLGLASEAWVANADYLRLDDLAPWASLLPSSTLPERYRPLIPTAKGVVQGLELQSEGQHAQSYSYSLRAENLGIGAKNLRQGGFGLHRVSGEIKGDQTGGRMQLSAKDALLLLAPQFTEAIPISTLSSTIHWVPQAKAWLLRAEDLKLQTLGIAAAGGFSLSSAEATDKNLKLKLDFSVADATRLKPYMPSHWSNNLRDWLSRGVQRAAIPKASLWIDGPLADFPYHRAATGTWGLDLQLKDAGLRFHPEWPVVEQLQGDVQFRGNGLVAKVRTAASGGVTATAARAEISNFGAAVLELNLPLQGEAERYYQYLRNSPLKQRLRGLITHTDGSGPVRAEVKLTLPLDTRLNLPTLVSGSVRLRDNQLTVHTLAKPVEQINGSLRFGDAAGVAAEGITARYDGVPLMANIVAEAGGIDTLNARFEADLGAADGPAADYLPDWLRAKLRGSTAIKLSLPLGGKDAGNIRLSSALYGVQSNLPAPLAKSANEGMPVQVDVQSDEKTPLRLLVDLRNRLGLTLRFARPADAPLKLAGMQIVLGGGYAGAAVEDGLRISGTLARTEPREWSALIGGIAGVGDSGLKLVGADISTQQLRLGSLVTGPLRLQAARSAEQDLRLSLSGASGKGEAVLKADGSVLTANLARLQLQPLTSTSGEPTATAKARDGAANFDPARLPALDIRVHELLVGGAGFGELQVKTQRESGGQTLSLARLHDGIATLAASGHWRRRGNAADAALDFTVASSDIAQMLKGLGFSPSVSSRSAEINGKLSWQSASGGLEWSLARGKLIVAARDGTLHSVEPGGAGRVLGLLNFYALPRRLLLDFRDVTNSGLSFDRIDGQYDLDGGIATAKEVNIVGPSVRMDLAGTLDLRAQTFDQNVTVTPNTSGLTLGAMLVGGASLAVAPPVGILALLANQVLDKPIGQVTQLSYRVTGPWDNPEIERVQALSSPEPTPATTPEPAATAVPTPALAPEPAPTAAPIPATEAPPPPPTEQP